MPTAIPESEVNEAAAKCVAFIESLVVLISDHFIALLNDGIDANENREIARDMLIANGMPPIRAANIVRLAVQRAGKLHSGQIIYSKDELRIICGRIAERQ